MIQKAITSSIMLKYIIVSSENDCVFAMVHSPVIASALVQGGLDFWSRSISPFVQRDLYNQIPTQDYFEKSIYKIEKNSLRPVEQSSVTDYWLHMRDVIRERRILFNIWESLIINALEKLTKHHSADFLRLADKQLALCDPDNQRFTAIIEDYAQTVGMTPIETYRHLKFQIENDEITRFKITAMAEKWIGIINGTDDIDQLKALRPVLYQALYGNSVI